MTPSSAQQSLAAARNQGCADTRCKLVLVLDEQFTQGPLMHVSRSLLVLMSVLWLPLAGHATETDIAPPDRLDGWSVAPPSSAGLDPAALIALTKAIEAGVTFPNIHALAISHHGALVFERYWPGEVELLTGEALGIVNHGPESLHDIRSVSKSVTSLLLGIALAGTNQGVLNRPIASFLPDRTDLSPFLADVTLHHVLTMTAGLAWNETIVPFDARNDFVRLFTSDDPIGYVLGKPLGNAPGTRWTYNSGLTDLVAGVVEHLTGQDFEAYAQDVLFTPLGISKVEWHRPEAWGPDRFPMASAGLRLRARDLAKIGALVLQDGVWEGRQIVPTEWIEASTQRHIQDTPWGPPGVYGYGYFWFPGTLSSGQSVIRGVGFGGQRLFILPDQNLVIAVFAGTHAPVGERILGRVLRALD